MTATYDGDVVAWANEQAALLRARKFDLLNLEHIADEVEDVGKSEERELARRMAVLIADLLKWAFQPDRRGRSRLGTIALQRKAIARRLDKTPAFGRTSTTQNGSPSFGVMGSPSRRGKPVLTICPSTSCGHSIA